MRAASHIPFYVNLSERLSSMAPIKWPHNGHRHTQSSYQHLQRDWLRISKSADGVRRVSFLIKPIH